MKAPICKVCGRAECGHVCLGAGGLVPVRARESGSSSVSSVSERSDRGGEGAAILTEAVSAMVGLGSRGMTYAPPGECEYCDRRREAAAAGMKTLRRRRKGAE